MLSSATIKSKNSATMMGRVRLKSKSLAFSISARAGMAKRLFKAIRQPFFRAGEIFMLNEELDVIFFCWASINRRFCWQQTLFLNVGTLVPDWNVVFKGILPVGVSGDAMSAIVERLIVERKCRG